MIVFFNFRGSPPSTSDECSWRGYGAWKHLAARRSHYTAPLRQKQERHRAIHKAWKGLPLGTMHKDMCAQLAMLHGKPHNGHIYTHIRPYINEHRPQSNGEAMIRVSVYVYARTSHSALCRAREVKVGKGGETSDLATYKPKRATYRRHQVFTPVIHFINSSYISITFLFLSS